MWSGCMHFLFGLVEHSFGILTRMPVQRVSSLISVQPNIGSGCKDDMTWPGGGRRHAMARRWKTTCHGQGVEDDMTWPQAMARGWKATCHGQGMEDDRPWPGGEGNTFRQSTLATRHWPSPMGEGADLLTVRVGQAGGGPRVCVLDT